MTAEIEDTQSKLVGVYQMNRAATTTLSNRPTPYSFEVDSSSVLFVNRFDMKTQSSQRVPLGSLVVVSAGSGDLIIDPDGYIAYIQPEIALSCGASTDCVKDVEFRVRENLKYNTPSWSLSGRQLSISSMIDLYGQAATNLTGFKISGQRHEQTKAAVAKDGARIRALAERSIAVAPEGDLQLTRMTLTFTPPAPASSTTVEHVVGSGKTYTACDSSSVVVPEQIQSIRINGDLSLVINPSSSPRSQDIIFGETTVGEQLITVFQAWNPFRCGTRSCSVLHLRIGDGEIQTEENIANCVRLTSYYSDKKTTARPNP